jgi:hypothetical protein
VAQTPALTQYNRRVDERKMGKCLWEVAELAAGSGVVFLRQQTDVVAEIEQALEELWRLGVLFDILTLLVPDTDA